MALKQVRAKTVYRPQARLEVFYTGGPAHLSCEGLLACACGDEVKVTARRILFVAHSAGVLCAGNRSPFPACASHELVRCTPVYV